MKRHAGKNHEGLDGEHRSYWLASTPHTTYPALRGNVAVDVAVVGGGIVGITTAALLRERGYSVALVEAERLVGGVTGNTTAKVTALPRLIYAYLINNFGREQALQYAAAHQAAIERIEALVAAYDIDCEFTRLPFFTFATTDKGLHQVEAEVEAIRDLGLPAPYVDAIPLEIPVRGAIRFDHQAQFHPVKYLLALAETIPGDGSFVFETSRVIEVTEGEPCTLKTEAGGIRAADVVIATHYPIAGKRAFYFARLHQQRHYALAVTPDRSFPRGMFIAAEGGGYAYRAAPSRHGELVIVSGGGHHKPGQAEDTRRYYRKLADHAREMYPAGQIRYRWAAQDVVTLDGLPYIGPFSGSSEHLYTATGFAAWGMATGTAAAMILSDLIHAGSNPWAPVFDPQRFTPQESARQFLKQSLDVARAFVGKRISVPEQELASIPPGAGRVIEVDDQAVAVFRDEDGQLHAVDPTCPHMGCFVAFNAAEQSWDCPCHGSRYAPDGSVLTAPARQGLARVALEAVDE
jgi:glycine/D-amino acid oxidase-like deaminating enzyme/nitrite reductase/ring-hydroxylating ferredoxin subunit